MNKLAIALAALLLAAALALGACGTSPGSGNAGGSISPNTVTLGATNFDQESVTIKAGAALTFDDTNGAFHQLCLGKDMKCDASAAGPAQLQGGGFAISAGQKKDVTFATAGTYAVTCTVHPSMNLTVTVQ